MRAAEGGQVVLSFSSDCRPGCSCTVQEISRTLGLFELQLAVYDGPCLHVSQTQASHTFVIMFHSQAPSANIIAWEATNLGCKSPCWCPAYPKQKGRKARLGQGPGRSNCNPTFIAGLVHVCPTFTYPFSVLLTPILLDSCAFCVPGSHHW